MKKSFEKVESLFLEIQLLCHQVTVLEVMWSFNELKYDWQTSLFKHLNVYICQSIK